MNIDYSKHFLHSINHANHAPFLPNNIFCVCAGATGSGKTNLMLNFLLNEEVLDYDKVYIYSSTLYQPAYNYLKDYYNNIESTVKKQYNVDIKIAYFFDANDEIKNPSELDSKQKHVMIFDDVMLTDQTKIKDYFCKGRHSNVNVFYSCQSLHKIAKHCIRDNANVFILFHQDDKALKYFYETNVSGDMDFKEFKKLCDSAWSKKHGYVLINLWEEAHCGRYISNYVDIYPPSKYIKIHKNT